MRAASLHGPGDLRLDDVPRPEAGPGELLVQVQVALCETGAREVLGEGVAGIADGRRVVALSDARGMCSEWVAVPESSLLELPRTLSPEVGALVEPLARCLICVERAELAAGDVVAIRDSGATALMLAACVADAGGWPVIVGGHALADEFGAHPGEGEHDVELDASHFCAHTPATIRAALGFLASGAYPWERLITHRVLLDDLPALFATPPAGLLIAAVVM